MNRNPYSLTRLVVTAPFATLISSGADCPPFHKLVFSQVPHQIVEEENLKSFMKATADAPAQIFYDELIQLVSEHHQNGMDRKSFEVVMDHFKTRAIQELYS